MTTRRDFLKTASLAGGMALLGLRTLWGREVRTPYFGLNAFVENHPDAVFVLRTSVDVKTNTGAIRTAGYQLGRTLFVNRADPAQAHSIYADVVIKPNITAWYDDIPPIEQTMGIQTDLNFVEGVIERLGDLGVAQEHIFIREANYSGSRIRTRPMVLLK